MGPTVMPKIRSNLQTIDSHQTLALCRDSLGIVANILGTLRGDLFDDDQRALILDICEGVENGRDELDRMLGELRQGLAAALDELLGNDTWEHPDQFFPPSRPRLDLGALLGHCRQRLDTVPESERPALEAVEAKLERAVDLGEATRHTFGPIRRRRRRR